MSQRVNHFPFSTSEEDHFKVIEKYFTERGPVYHQFESYEFLVNHGLQRIIDECNSIEITTKTTSGANASTVKHNLYKATFGQTYWEKASVTDENRVILHLTPNEARLRDITYDSPIFVDIKEEFWEDGVKVNQINHPKVFLLRMPTMVGSSKCNLYGKTIPECIALGECENDPRGYFIVNGKERALICQERLCHSHVYVFENNSDKYVAEMRSMSEETGHSVLIKAVIDKDFRNCCFSLPYMSKEVLAGAVFKALGFSNEEILQLIQPSSVQETKMAKRLIRDSIVFQTREDAILYISKSSIQKVEDSEEHRIHYTTQVIENELFPHMGISTSLEKGIFLGTMINKLFRVSTGARSFDDRDNVSIKRIEGPGMLLGDLFRMCLKRYCDNLKKYLEKRQDIITAISRTNSITQAIRAPMCFVKGTLVSLSNGTSVPIEQLETLGANVLGWNKETCLLEPSTQTHFFNQGKRDTIVLTFEDGRKIQCTPEHKLLVFQNEKPSWIEASTIPNGCDVICCKKYPDLSTSLVKLVDIRKGESEIVYDITVENTHSFLANGIVSSNCTGNWAAQKNTYVRTGVSQIMSRLTYPATISHLRRIVIPIGKEGKNVKVRQIHPTQSFFIDIIESPEGKGIGIIKNFALLSKLTVGCNPILVRRFIEQSRHIKSTDQFLTMTRPNLVLLNGVLVGLADNIDECYQEFRRLKFDEHIFSDQVSFIMDREEREIRIFCDAGRFMRPLINVVPNDDEKNDTGAPLTIALRKEHVVKSWMDLLESGVILYVDSNEVENSLIAMYPSDLIEHSSQPYNYCEIHPSTMLGVCSSVIPYGEHNQCIYKDEPVYLADGTTKPICKVKVGDKVITFDPETQKNTIASVSHIHAAKTEKKVYKVTTINHRSITATFDHPFMTSEGWKHVEDIKLNSTKVAISLEPKPVSVDVEHFLVLDDHMFREKCDGYNTDCNFSSFNLPLYSTSPFVIIIARLFGYCSSIDKDLLVNSLVFSLTFDSQYSMELFMYDIGQLGLTSEKSNVDKSKNKITYHGLVPLLLISLGITDEKLPYWITNGSDMVKREFLAGVQNDTNCKSLYDYFETKPIDEIVDNKQLINYVDTIGFRYNVTRQAKFGSIVEYMRHTQTISYEEWKKSTEVKLSTIFLPIISKEISLENEICDITIDSPNQSFICGDNFCVHNCPRLVYESSMMKQALGVYALSYKNRYDTISHVMAYPQKALVDTKYNKMLHYDEMLTGINPIVAIMCYTGFNQEDSVILNKASVDRGMFVTTAYRTLTYEEKKKTNCSFEKIEIPPLSCQSKAMNYSKLAKNGIVHKGVPVYKGDVIVGKTLTKVQKEEQEEKIDCSLSISSGEEGIIDEIWVGKTEEGYMMVKVKIRQLRIPEVGDKMASRSSQKGVCGLLLEQENMPFTQQGITPDLLMNAHCFTAETQISLCNGLSKPISKMFIQGGEYVWTHNKIDKEEGDSGIVVSVNKSMGCGGVKKIVKLTMEDGRTIRCTPNHKFYTKDGEWIEAQDMVLGTTQLQMSIEGVEDVVSETEYEIEQKWEFAEFNMKTNENREKSMAFARILGFLLADGCICETGGRHSCPISFGHKMDAELCKQDIYLLTQKSPKICENKSSIGLGYVYIVYLPCELIQLIIKLDGITVGRRTQQITTWPSFIFDSPLCFVREFLAGLFGGDGHAPYIKGEHVNEIRFCQTSNMEYEESFTQKMQLLCDLLNRFDVNACIERTRYYHKDTHGKTKPLPVEPFDKKDYMATVYIIVKDTLAFTEKIGMRYCLEKMCRLSLYKSYKLLQQRVKDQSEAVFGLVNKYMNEKKSTEKSIELARSEFFKTNTNLNNYYTFGISGKTQVGNRRKPNRSSDVLHLSYKHFPTFKQYIENLGCSEWYSKDKYIIDKESTAIPTFFMKVIGRVDDGEEPIYCFNVEKYNNFIAGGICVTNSIPSRMTMSQMLECMYSKACALGGTFGDSTAFSDTSIDPVEDISKKLQAFGFQKYGNERMYSGFTGEMLDAEIFIGPTYYQRLKHLVADKIHCLTTDHEVLTRNGWKPITEITLDDKVATLDKNGYLVYQEPKSIMNYPEYRGNMYYVETENVDLAVTANHRMWVKDLSSASYDFKRADEVFNIPVYYKNNANWRELENSLTSVTKDKIIELVFELKLLKTDVVPEWIFTLNSGYVRMFLDTLNQFTSESKYIIDQLQQLLLHSGGWSGVVITNESAKKYTLLIDKSQKDPFVQGGDRLVENQKCHVVCLSVPNEIFYVRRNGKAVWTGNSRATGNVTMMHHQPSEGRSREGGLRVGEMERDALISHGGAAFIQETLFDMSDQYQINVCENCGNIVSSATACRMCKTGQINRTNIPYCAKLLFQELEAMGINIQINTKEEKKDEKKT